MGCWLLPPAPIAHVNSIKLIFLLQLVVEERSNWNYFIDYNVENCILSTQSLNTKRKKGFLPYESSFHNYNFFSSSFFVYSPFLLRKREKGERVEKKEKKETLNPSRCNLLLLFRIPWSHIFPQQKKKSTFKIIYSSKTPQIESP